MEEHFDVFKQSWIWAISVIAAIVSFRTIFDWSDVWWWFSLKRMLLQVGIESLGDHIGPRFVREQPKVLAFPLLRCRHVCARFALIQGTSLAGNGLRVARTLQPPSAYVRRVAARPAHVLVYPFGVHAILYTYTAFVRKWLNG